MSTDLSEHMVRRFVMNNSLSVLNKDVGEIMRPWRPETASAANPFTGWATLVFHDLDGLYRGGGLVSFRGIDLPTLFKNISPVVYLYNPKSTREIADELCRRYGIPMQASWFVNTAFDYNTIPTTVQLETVATNYCHQAFLNVRVERANADVAEIFANNVLDYPQLCYTPEASRVSAEFSYHQDFTPDSLQEYKFLKAYPTERITTDTLYAAQGIGVLSALIEERLGWKPFYQKAEALETTDVCFFNSQLVYNGSTKKYVHPDRLPSSPTADTWYDNVLVVRFDTSVSGVQGLGYFHYNDLS